MNAETAERIAMALESIAKDVKRFVDAAERNEAESKYGGIDVDGIEVFGMNVKQIAELQHFWLMYHGKLPSREERST